MAPVDNAGAGGAARLQWLGWDDRTLHWKVALVARMALALRIDGVVFERYTLDAGEHALHSRFACSPTGNDELEFSFAYGDAAPALGAPWRVRFAAAAPAGIDQWTQAPPHLAPLADTPSLPARPLAALPPVAVVVPIFNAAASVRRCLDALARCTAADVRWILVDDASTDPAIATLLAQHASSANVHIERHAVNRGYTSAVNTGIAAAGTADVVLLNSDTEVGPRWLESLRLAAYGDPTIGTVTAVSDNAGAFSVPELEQYCPIPPAWTLAEAQRAVLQQAGLRFPELPTGNGFCLLIKRELIDRIGVFDADAFPMGYGEENDFCQRAVAAGWRNVIAGNVLVRHERSASFGDARRAALGVQGMAVLRRRYPRYEADVGETLYSFLRRVLDYRVRRAYAGAAQAQPPPRPRLLIAGSHDDDVRRFSAAGDFDVFVLADEPLRLRRLTRHESTDVATAAQGADDNVVLKRWLMAWAIERVHAPATAAVRAAAADLGIPVEAGSGA